MKHFFKATTKQINNFHTGRVEVYIDDNYQYSHSTGQPKMNKSEALNDARLLLQGLLNENPEFNCDLMW